MLAFYLARESKCLKTYWYVIHWYILSIAFPKHLVFNQLCLLGYVLWSNVHRFQLKKNGQICHTRNYLPRVFWGAIGMNISTFILASGEQSKCSSSRMELPHVRLDTRCASWRSRWALETYPTYQRPPTRVSGRVRYRTPRRKVFLPSASSSVWVSLARKGPITQRGGSCERPWRKEIWLRITSHLINGLCCWTGRASAFTGGGEVCTLKYSIKV